MVENTSNSPDEDCIDLIDVVGWFWRAKISIGICMILGVGVALGWVELRQPPRFVTVVPVAVEGMGGATANVITTKFSTFVSRQSVLAGLQKIVTTELVNDNPISLVPNSDGFNLELRSMRTDSTGEIALKAANFLASEAVELNKNAQLDLKNNQSFNLHHTAEVERFCEELIRARTLEASPIEIRIFEIEASLASRARGLLIPFDSWNGFSSDGVLRLLGYLGSRISTSEREKIITDYAAFAGKLRVIDLKYEGAACNASQMHDGSAKNDFIQKIISVIYFPIVKVNNDLYGDSVASKVHERIESKRKIYIIFGLIFGGLTGIVAYGVTHYLRDNVTRIRKIFT